jgi:hypothetical protein
MLFQRRQRLRFDSDRLIVVEAAAQSDCSDDSRRDKNYTHHWPLYAGRNEQTGTQNWHSTLAQRATKRGENSAQQAVELVIYLPQ